MSLAEWSFLLFLVVVAMVLMAVAMVLVAVIVFCLVRLYTAPGPRRRGVHRG